MKYKLNDICVVSYGGVFPDAVNPNDFFANLLNKKISVKDFRNVNQGELNHELACFYSKDAKDNNRTNSPMGAYINRIWIKNFAKSLNVNVGKHTTTEIIALEAAGQVLESVLKKIEHRDIDIIIGNTSVDNEFIFQREREILLNELDINENSDEYLHLEKKLKNILIPRIRYTAATSLLDIIKKKFSLNGVAFLTDAACASSFAAIYSSYQRLRNNESRYVLTGGVDVNLCPFLQVMFSKAGVLSKEVLNPFDEKANGMNQGEAAGLVLLTTIEQALKDNLTIYGVIKNCNGSSDGNKGGIIEPTIEGQLLAYERVYLNGKPQRFDYIEAHGTATTVGDKVEIQSLSNFFKDKTPIGSVKANIGHTIGAAGVSSLIKCLEIIKNKKIPPMPQFSKFSPTVNTNLFVNTEVIDLNSKNVLNFASSSFGFGGTNFHLHLQSFNEDNLDLTPIVVTRNATRVIYCAKVSIKFEEIEELLQSTKFRIPPVDLPAIDKMVLAGFLGVEKLLKEKGINLPTEARLKIATISAGTLTLDLGAKLQDGLALECLKIYSKEYKELSNKIEQIQKQLQKFPPEFGAGGLNNLIAGRAAKFCDFRGVNFHIDADVGSREVGTMMAKSIITQQDGAVFLLSANEHFDEDESEFKRTGICVELFASEQFAQKYELPIISEILRVDW